MIVMFTARRLKPGAWDQFRRAWDPGEDKPPGFQRAYHAQNIRDADEIISFGLFDMSIDDYHRWRGEADAAENQRVDRLSAFVENEHVSGSLRGRRGRRRLSPPEGTARTSHYSRRTLSRATDATTTERCRRTGVHGLGSTPPGPPPSLPRA